MDDPAINETVRHVEAGETSPLAVRKEVSHLPILLRGLNKLKLQNGFLYRKREAGEESQSQLVLPESCRVMVLKRLCGDMGHLGMERLNLV